MILNRAARNEVHAELRADHHERIGNVVPRIAHEDERATGKISSERFTQRQHVSDHLSRMPFVGEAVPHGAIGVFRKFLDDRLTEAAILDAIVETRQHASRVGNRFLLRDLRARRIEERNSHAKIVTCHLERATRARRSLLEQQHDVLSFKVAMRFASMLLRLELLGNIDHVPDVIAREIEELEEIASFEACHFGPFQQSNQKGTAPFWLPNLQTGAPSRNRTYNRRIRSPMLYPLSHGRASSIRAQARSAMITQI